MKTPFPLIAAALLISVLTVVGADRKLVLIAGNPSHGPGDHEHRAGCLLFQKCLEQVPGLEVTVVSNAWPRDLSVFEGADAVAVYADGGLANPFIQRDRPQLLSDLTRKGVGIGCIHYAVEVPKEKGGAEFIQWIGGHYEHAYSCNPMWSPEYSSFPNHPITRGVKPFTIRDEWYMHMRFRPELEGVTPILVAQPSDDVRDGPYVYPQGPYDHIVAGSGQDEIMMWATERPDGGRGFGFTGGHYHRNWGNENFRKIVLNALVWIAKAEVPPNGIDVQIPPEFLEYNLDRKPGQKTPLKPGW